jgi:hypothetical protein
MTSSPPLAFSQPRRFRIGFLAVFCSAAWVASAAAVGDNLLKNGDANDGLTNWGGFTSVEADPEGGGNCFLLPSPGYAISQEFIPVDMQTPYTLAGRFRSQGDAPARLYIGFECFDEQKQRINNEEINAMPGTETELAAAAVAGSALLKIRDGAAWEFDPAWSPAHGAVAFHVQDNHADLPNRDLSPIGISSIRKTGDGWEVVLSKPLERDYPAGTKVRQHRRRDTFCYVEKGTNLAADAVWTERAASISGATPFGSTGLAFWPGTRFVRVIVTNPPPQAAGQNSSPALVGGLSFSSQ